MSRFPNFTLSEFVKSDTAKRRGIDNTPDFEEVEHLEELVEKFIQPLRIAYGKPIIVSSGYRCEKLNKAVGGVTSSVHMRGWAADLQISGNIAKFNEFTEFVKKWVREKNIQFDQLITENKGKTYWLHVGLRSNNGCQRRQIKTIVVK